MFMGSQGAGDLGVGETVKRVRIWGLKGMVKRVRYGVMDI